MGKEEEAVIFAGDFNSLPTMEPYLIARLVVFLSFHPCHFCHTNGDLLDDKFGSLSRDIHHNQNMLTISVILMELVDIVKVTSTQKCIFVLSKVFSTFRYSQPPHYSSFSLFFASIGSIQQSGWSVGGRIKRSGG